LGAFARMISLFRKILDTKLVHMIHVSRPGI
jgi:hypothetical protein